jgi:hypothetical protein
VLRHAVDPRAVEGDGAGARPLGAGDRFQAASTCRPRWRRRRRRSRPLPLRSRPPRSRPAPDRRW